MVITKKISLPILVTNQVLLRASFITFFERIKTMSTIKTVAIGLVILKPGSRETQTVIIADEGIDLC